MKGPNSQVLIEARQRIIVGSTVVGAIRDAVPATLTILELLQRRITGGTDWHFVQPIFYRSNVSRFLADFLFDYDAEWPDPSALNFIYQINKGELEQGTDPTQSGNGSVSGNEGAQAFPETLANPRQQRAADARRKIIIGCAVLTAIRDGDAATPVILALLDDRVATQRHRDIIRSIFPSS